MPLLKVARLCIIFNEYINTLPMFVTDTQTFDTIMSALGISSTSQRSSSKEGRAPGALPLILFCILVLLELIRSCNVFNSYLTHVRASNQEQLSLSLTCTHVIQSYTRQDLSLLNTLRDPKTRHQVLYKSTMFFVVLFSHFLN